MANKVVCPLCGVPLTEAMEVERWRLHELRKDEKQLRPALVFYSEWLQENIQDEEDHEVLMNVMGKDMRERGLCPGCGLPDFRGLSDDDFYTEEEAKEMAEMWAEQAAERRMGA